MKWFRRMFTSIIRKPAQSILMFVIVFVLGNVLFASIAIKQTSEDVRMEMRNRIPSYLTMERTNSSQAEAIDFKIRQVLDELKQDNERIKNIAIVDKVEVVSCEKDLFIDDSSDSVIYENYDFISIDNIKNSMFDYEFVSGRYYTQEEIEQGKPVIILPEGQYYKLVEDENGYMVAQSYGIGDKIKFNLYNYKIVEKNITDKITSMDVETDMDNLVEFEFEVIGLYSGNKKAYKPQYSDLDSWNLYAIELSSKCVDEMITKQEEALNDHTNEEKDLNEMYGWNYLKAKNYIQSIRITTRGMDASDELQEILLANTNYPKSYFKMNSSIEDYRYIQGPLENLVALADVALWASVVLIIVLLGLVSILFIRNRTFEIGVLMAIGEKKIKILAQFMCEIVLVGLLAASFSMISGNALGGMISEEFMKIQIDTDYEMDYQEENPDMVTQLDLLETYDVELDAGYIGSIYLISTIILVVSSAAPIIYILNIKPKKVLM